MFVSIFFVFSMLITCLIQWGGHFESDGLLRGDQKTETVQCQAGSCAIKVPAPSVAVVFLTDDLVFDASAGDAVQTFVFPPLRASNFLDTDGTLSFQICHQPNNQHEEHCRS